MGGELPPTQHIIVKVVIFTVCPQPDHDHGDEIDRQRDDLESTIGHFSPYFGGRSFFQAIEYLYINIRLYKWPGIQSSFHISKKTKVEMGFGEPNSGYIYAHTRRLTVRFM